MANISIRYIVNNVDEAIRFYTGQLDFHLVMHPDPAFAILMRDDLRLLLSAPNDQEGIGKSTGKIQPKPGGWNRFHLEVNDLETTVENLKKDGAHFRNDIVSGVSGRQIILEDPSGNPIELFEYYNENPRL